MSEPTVNKNLTVEPATEPQMVRCPKWKECETEPCEHKIPHIDTGDQCTAAANQYCVACVPVGKEPAAPKDKGIKLPFQGQYICPPNKPTDMSCKDINSKGCSKCIYDWLNDEANRQHNELCKELKEENKRLRERIVAIQDAVHKALEVSHD